MYWAQKLAAQSSDKGLAAKFDAVAKAMTDGEATIVEELNSCQGVEVELHGYFHGDDTASSKAMRPSSTLNAIIDAI